jgi:dCTP deaminase
MEKPTETGLQPSSIDLRLGDWVKCTKASFLPTDEPVAKTLARYGRYDFPLSDNDTNVLEKGSTYIVPLMEATCLPEGFTGYINPKSSTGRADVLTRVLSDGMPNFDIVGPGKRQLYIEITPLSWDVRVKRGLALTQMRVGFGNTTLDEAELRIASASAPLLYGYNKKPIPAEQVKFRNDGIEVTADLQSSIVAYRARENSQLELNLSLGRGALADRAGDFWEPIERPKHGELVLEPNQFYLLATRERTSFPHTLCGTLEAYDPASSEGRVHYAGFIDPGFGFGEAGEFRGTPITLEMRVYHTPFRIVNGQPIGVLRHHRMRAVPIDGKGAVAAYGVGMFTTSNYQNQRPGPNMGKQFLEKRA